MNMIEAPKDSRTEQLVDRMFIIIWANQILKEYNNLPKETSRERKSVNNLVARTAVGLLQNPQDISIADKTWQRHEVCENQAQKLEEPFSELVRKERLELIKDKWENVTPEQLAGLVRAREFGQDLLRNYFKGPRSRNQRIDAYYNFVSGVLDLAGEEEAFIEGMKIALHATDILPKNPSLIEQAILVSFPRIEEESVFKKAVVVNYIISQLRFLVSQEFGKYYQEAHEFVNSNEAQEEFRKRQQLVTNETGKDNVMALNGKMLFFFRTISLQFLTKESRQALKDVWPFSFAFDENDRLNQKFQKIQLQLASRL